MASPETKKKALKAIQTELQRFSAHHFKSGKIKIATKENGEPVLIDARTVFQTVLDNLTRLTNNTIPLSGLEDKKNREADKSIIDTQLRRHLLDLFATEEVKGSDNQALYDSIHGSLVALNKCWPTNNYEDKDDATAAPICHVSLEKIEDKDKIFTSFGLLDRSSATRLVDDFKKDTIIGRPISQRDRDYVHLQMKRSRSSFFHPKWTELGMSILMVLAWAACSAALIFSLGVGILGAIYAPGPFFHSVTGVVEGLMFASYGIYYFICQTVKEIINCGSIIHSMFLDLTHPAELAADRLLKNIESPGLSTGLTGDLLNTSPSALGFSHEVGHNLSDAPTDYLRADLRGESGEFLDLEAARHDENPAVQSIFAIGMSLSQSEE